jgi:hypothetical protein
MEKVLYNLSQAADACFDAGFLVSRVMYEKPSRKSSNLISRAKQEPIETIFVFFDILGPEYGAIKYFSPAAGLSYDPGQTCHD